MNAKKAKALRKMVLQVSRNLGNSQALPLSKNDPVEYIEKTHYRVSFNERHNRKERVPMIQKIVDPNCFRGVYRKVKKIEKIEKKENFFV